jgi:arylsulfatase
MDFLPTFLDLAGVDLPPVFEKLVESSTHDEEIVTRKMSTFRGKDVHAIRGKSWLPLFSQGKKVEDDEIWQIHSSDEPIGWELFARGALRKGDWKIVHFSKAQGGAGDADEGWELFNVVEDPGETRDFALDKPEKLEELLEYWEAYVVECGVVWGQSALTPGLDITEAPDLWEDEVELQKAWMGAGERECPVDCS